MGIASKAVTAAVIESSASQAAALTALNYSFADGKPGGMVDVAVTAGAGISQVVSSTLQESNSTAVNGGYNSVAVMPDSMAVTTTISVTVTVGSLSVTANNRAVGPGVFSADGTKGVYFRFASQSSTAVLCSWSGGTESTQKSLASQVASAGDTLTLTGTLSGGAWTWTCKKNGGADIVGLTWADSSHVIDLPGVKPGVAFRHQYSSSQYGSRGVTNIAATAT